MRFVSFTHGLLATIGHVAIPAMRELGSLLLICSKGRDELLLCDLQ